MPAGGAVRVRPMRLASAPNLKRYQYQRSGSRPWSSTWRLWPSSGRAIAMPFRTTRAIFSSLATCHSTATGSAGMPPPWNGSGASRVQITKPSGIGSPDATPRGNGYPESLGPRLAARAGGAESQPTAASAPAPARSWRRPIAL